MKGQIYENRGGFIVRFGRDISKWFKTREQAERFLTGLRYETDQGKFDIRDYAKDKPLAFSNLVEKYLVFKEQKVKPSSLRNLKNYLGKASAAWMQTNIKAIGYAQIEDFLWDQQVSEKTRSDMCSALHAFWAWLVRRDVLEQMPKFPQISYELGWRNIIDLDTQRDIIEEVGRISAHISPKIVLGIRWLSTYVSIRPAEMLGLKEGQIDHKLGCFIIPSPKEKKPKVVPLLDEDLDALKQIPRGLPDLPFFRHDKTANGAKAGQAFGKRMFYKWWVRACENLGIEGWTCTPAPSTAPSPHWGRYCLPSRSDMAQCTAPMQPLNGIFRGQAANAKQAYVEARKLQQTYNGKSHPKVANAAELLHINGGSDETRTRDLRRDRPAF
jgi:integrase